MESNQKGLSQIKLIIGLMIGIEAFTVIVSAISGASSGGFSFFIRLLLTLTLCYFLYVGKNWARIVTIILSILAILGGIGSLLYFLSFGITLALIFLLYIIIYGYITITLIRSNSIKAYIASMNV